MVALGKLATFKSGRTIAEVAYGNYQLKWMIRHGFSIKDLIGCMQGIFACDKESYANKTLTVESVYKDFLNLGFGFNNECYDSFDEFLHNKYLDKELVQDFLDAEDYQRYLQSYHSDEKEIRK